MRARIILACVACSLSSGCASIMCGDDKTINIQSDPPGANFVILRPGGDVVTQGTTPTNVTLKRGRGYFQAGDYMVRFVKEGYEDLSVPIEQGYETGWYFAGNIIVFGGLLGLVIVDPITGAMWDIKDVQASLEPSAFVETPGGTKKIAGYKAHVNPRTGVIETVPVYEPDKK